MTDDPRPSRLGAAAALIAFVVAILYVILVATQGDETTQGTVITVTLSILGAGALVAAGVTRPKVEDRFGYLAGGALALFVLGLMGIFSIGAPLLVAGALAAAAAYQVRPQGNQRGS